MTNFIQSKECRRSTLILIVLAFCALTVRSAGATKQASKSEQPIACSSTIDLSFPPASLELATAIRDAMDMQQDGVIELASKMNPKTLRALQAIDRLDIRREDHRRVLGAMTQFLPADFAQRLTAYLASPMDSKARELAAVIEAAYAKGASLMKEEASKQYHAVLESASQGTGCAAQMEALARVLDACDIYGPGVWTMTNNLRHLALAYRQPQVMEAADKIAAGFLAGKTIDDEDASATIERKTETPAEAAKAPQVVGQVSSKYVMDAVLGAFNAESRAVLKVVENKGWTTLLRKADGQLVFAVSTNPQSNGKFVVQVVDAYSGVEQVLVENGLVFAPMDNKVEGSKLYSVEPGILSPKDAQDKYAANSLGSGSGGGQLVWKDDADYLRNLVKMAKMPPETETAVLAEVDRYAGMMKQQGNMEAGWIRKYIETMLKYPWSRRTVDHIDLVKARQVLDKNQYGLDKVKDRIIEFLAVRKRKGDSKGAILCFAGPPGVGKTAIAKSIAEAMGRTYTRMALGGAQDEAKLRGFRRTYVGADAGDLVKSMIAAGTKNPVFVLDEIDKVTHSGGINGGNIEAALLEVLDPEQNSAFHDNFVEQPVDLSEVVFIATANELDKIYPALRDRMEIIEFPSYSPDEKLQIAQRHLVPQQRDKNALKPEEISLTDAAMQKVVQGYTMEAGVRGLRQTIDELMRKIVALAEMGTPAPGLIDEKDVAKYLGQPAFGVPTISQNQVGVNTALAVSGLGGMAFNVEVVSYPGKGNVKLRNQFKEMASDSANNVMALLRSRAGALGIDPEVFTTKDVDIVFTPWSEIDGPSAGITMTTAVASELTGRKIRRGIAMTGELAPKTGKVNPIGGLDHKVMGAYRAGIYTVMYPAKNHQDLEKVPADIRDQMKFIPVSTIDEVLRFALDDAPAAQPGS